MVLASELVPPQEGDVTVADPQKSEVVPSMVSHLFLIPSELKLTAKTILTAADIERTRLCRRPF